MPTVEKVGPRRVAVQALPGVRLQGAETDASMGVGRLEAEAGTRLAASRAAAQGTAVGIDIFAQQQLQRRKEMAEARAAADQTAVMAAQNKMNEMRRTRVHGPEGTMTKLGKDAFGEPEAVSAEFETAAGEVMKGLATPEQRLAFEKWLVGERDSINLAVLDHTNRQMKAYEANELEASTENAVDISIRENMLDVRQGALKLNDAEANIRRVGPRIGLTPAMIEAQVKAMRTQSVEGTVNAMVASGRAQDASRFYRGTKDSPGAQETIDPQRHKAIMDTIEAGEVRGQSQDETARILAATGDFETQRKMAKAIANDKVSDETLTRIEHEHAVQEKQKQDVHRTFLRGIANKLDATKSITSIPANDWDKLDLDEKRAFRAYVKDLIEYGDVNADRRVWLAEVQAADADPLKWAQGVNLEKKIHQMSKADFNDLVNLRSSILNGNRKGAQAAMDGILSNVAVVNNVLQSSGIDTSPKEGTPEAKLHGDLMNAIDREVQRQQNISGKRLDNDQIRKIADAFAIDTVIQPGTGNYRDIINPWRDYGDTRGRLGVAFAQIPEDRRVQIEATIKANGEEASYANILSYWLEYQRTLSGQPPKPAPSRGPQTGTGLPPAQTTPRGVAPNVYTTPQRRGTGASGVPQAPE